MDNEVSRRALTFSSLSLDEERRVADIVVIRHEASLELLFSSSSSSVQLVIIQPIVGAVNAWTRALHLSL